MNVLDRCPHFRDEQRIAKDAGVSFSCSFSFAALSRIHHLPDQRLASFAWEVDRERQDLLDLFFVGYIAHERNDLAPDVLAVHVRRRTQLALPPPNDIDPCSIDCESLCGHQTYSS